MCLFTRLSEARTADKDITCYKVVYPGELRNHSSNVFVGLVMDFVYKVGKTYKERHFKNTPEKDVTGRPHLVYQGFHSYRTIKEALHWATFGKIILKCVIPAGSLYYYDPDKVYYCSNQIKIIGWRHYGKAPLVWNTKERNQADANELYNLISHYYVS